MEEEEIVRKERSEKKEKEKKEEKVREQLLKMETRVGMVEQQMTACQKRSSCNGQILGELLYILPPLLPMSSLEKFSQFSSNLSSGAPTNGSQQHLPPPPLLASVSIPVNNPTFDGDLPTLTVSGHNNSKSDATTPKHLKYFTATGKILEVDSIKQQEKPRGAKNCERNKNDDDPENKATLMGEVADDLTSLNNDENTPPLSSSSTVIRSGAVLDFGTENGQIIIEEEDTDRLKTVAPRKECFSNKYFAISEIFPNIEKSVFKEQTSLTDDCANSDNESEKPTGRLKFSNKNNVTPVVSQSRSTKGKKIENEPPSKHNHSPSKTLTMSCMIDLPQRKVMDKENRGSDKKENKDNILRRKEFEQERSCSSKITQQKITGQKTLFNGTQVTNTETLLALSDETKSKVKGEEKEIGEKRKTSTLSSVTYLLQSEKEAPGIFEQDEKQERASFLFSELKAEFSEFLEKEITGRIIDTKRGTEEWSRSKTSGKKTTIIRAGYKDGDKRSPAKTLFENHESRKSHSIRKENEKPVKELGKMENHGGKQLETDLFAAKSGIKSAIQSSKQDSTILLIPEKSSSSKKVLPASKTASPSKSVASASSFPKSFAAEDDSSPSSSGLFGSMHFGQKPVASAESSNGKFHLIQGPQSNCSKKATFAGKKVERGIAYSKRDHQTLFRGDLTVAETSSRLDHQVLDGENLSKARNSKRLDPQSLKSEYSSSIKHPTKYHQQLVAGDLTKEEALDWKTCWREVATSSKRQLQ